MYMMHMHSTRPDDPHFHAIICLNNMCVIEMAKVKHTVASHLLKCICLFVAHVQQKTDETCT